MNREMYSSGLYKGPLQGCFESIFQRWVRGVTSCKKWVWNLKSHEHRTKTPALKTHTLLAQASRQNTIWPLSNDICLPTSPTSDRCRQNTLPTSPHHINSRCVYECPHRMNALCDAWILGARGLMMSILSISASSAIILDFLINWIQL